MNQDGVSAFGIVHDGEVSKLFGRKKATVKPVAPLGATSAPLPPGRLKRVGTKAGSANLSLNSIGDSTGKGVGRTGRVAEKALRSSPGLTGAAVVGGTGYGLYHYGQKTGKKGPSKKATGL